MDLNEYGKIFSRNLRFIMIDAGITQADMARDLGIGKTTISTWMNGVHVPRMDKVDMLCNYLHCTRADLMEPHDDDYYTNKESAQIAQEMFEDEDLRALFHMKKDIDPAVFAAHMRMMRELYDAEHRRRND